MNAHSVSRFTQKQATAQIEEYPEFVTEKAAVNYLGHAPGGGSF
jgi:hypothetical protein